MVRVFASAMAVFALALSFPSAAQNVSPGSLASPSERSAGAPLTLRQAVIAALGANPDLKTFSYSLKAQEARGDQAALRPLPTLGLEVENAWGSGAYKNFESAEMTFSLSQVIELGDKRGRRMDVARFGLEGVDVERQAAQLDVLAEVTRRFIQVASSQQQLELTRQNVELNRKTVEAVKRRVEGAKSPRAELNRANVAMRRAELELRHAEHELLASRRKLAAMWGEPEAAFGPVETDLYRMPVPLEFDKLIARLQTNPDFTRFASEARLRDAEVRLAQAQRMPDLQLTGGVRRFESSNDRAFVLGVSMPLFAGRQAAPAIAEAQARRGEVDARRDATFIKARAQIFDVYQELRHAIAETEMLQKDILPQMEAALRETQYAYERGRYSYLELVDAQRAFLEAKRGLIEAAANAQLFQTEIERLTGEPLNAKD